jgi:hypothetical protein
VDERDRQVYDVVPFNLWSLAVTQHRFETAPATKLGHSEQAIQKPANGNAQSI